MIIVDDRHTITTNHHYRELQNRIAGIMNCTATQIKSQITELLEAPIHKFAEIDAHENRLTLLHCCTAATAAATAND